MIALKQAAEAAAAAGNRRRARSRLRRAGHRLVSFAHRVVSLSGSRAILPAPVAADLLAQEGDILADLDVLLVGFQ